MSACVALFCFFFFQAEDGIRDLTVTGVQTCALPICHSSRRVLARCAESALGSESYEIFGSLASRCVPDLHRSGHLIFHSFRGSREWAGAHVIRCRLSGAGGPRFPGYDRVRTYSVEAIRARDQRLHGSTTRDDHGDRAILSLHASKWHQRTWASLFRPYAIAASGAGHDGGCCSLPGARRRPGHRVLHRAPWISPGTARGRRLRSEEHTSELQSQSNLVCRLLLEKKKI